MEVDIDLSVSIPSSEESSIRTALPSGYVMEESRNDSNPGETRFLIRYKDERSRQIQTNVGVLIVDFLSKLTSLENILRKFGGELRLGIYYELKETAVFPFRLPSECIHRLASLNLSLESTGYPCSDD